MAVLCCDWGTSTFRLRLVEPDNLEIYGELMLPMGISKTYHDWELQSMMEGVSKATYFSSQLKTCIEKVEKESGIEAQDCPVIISGMASSSIGMEEVSYASLPFSVDGSGASVKKLPKTSSFPYEILLISGVRSESDVMRGEEAQLVGLLALERQRGREISDGTFIFPGTHSKHITVRKNAISAFKTYMTGELFHLLGNNSILQQSIDVADPADLEYPGCREAFSRGLNASATGQVLLHSLFMVRTNRLFEKMNPKQNYFYLSGLLIGSELSSLNVDNEYPLIVSAAPNLALQYRIAVEELRFRNPIFIEPEVAETAALAGQIQIYKQHHANQLA